MEAQATRLCPPVHSRGMTAVQRHKLVYWSTQLGAWGLWVIVVAVYDSLDDQPHPGLWRSLLIILATAVGLSHLLRNHIKREEWLEMRIDRALGRILWASVLLGALSYSLQALTNDLFLPGMPSMLRLSTREVFSLVLNWTIMFVLWSFGYFAYHWFVAHRREEVRNLRLESAMRENELNMLRSQMNPHFIFNAMNSIRALIDEDPATAKQAITQLSGILRSSLLMGRKRSVPLNEELAVVRDYLALERIRFEERLTVEWDIDPATEQCPVPPMMVQTLAENAVKHGIAKLTKGGVIRISAHQGAGEVLLTVSNSGSLDNTVHQRSGTGIGLNNTRKRLALLYGEQAVLSITEHSGMVTTRVSLPQIRIPSLTATPQAVTA